MGGRYTWAFFFAFIFAMFITEILNAFYTWFLGYWASQYETHDPASVSVSQYALDFLFRCVDLLTVYQLHWNIL